VMFSSDAVHDVHENFPFRSHPDPPSYELPTYTVSKKAFSLAHILHVPTWKSNGGSVSVSTLHVMPAQAGIQFSRRRHGLGWIPAGAGMTFGGFFFKLRHYRTTRHS
jgi:hypothetical protein